MTFDPSPIPVTETSLGCYFKDRLTTYGQRMRPPPQEDTYWYLGNLLERLSRSEQLLTYQDGNMTLRPLALIYGDALQASNERERCTQLQNLGDLALFLGAIFPHMYERYGIFRDYFIGMGGNAYDYLADNARHNRHIFAELSRTFARILGLVAEACSRTHPMSNEDILTLYQRWQETGDALAETQLRDLGLALSGSEKLQ